MSTLPPLSSRLALRSAFLLLSPLALIPNTNHHHMLNPKNLSVALHSRSHFQARNKAHKATIPSPVIDTLHFLYHTFPLDQPRGYELSTIEAFPPFSITLPVRRLGCLLLYHSGSRFRQLVVLYLTFFQCSFRCSGSLRVLRVAASDMIVFVFIGSVL